MKSVGARHASPLIFKNEEDRQADLLLNRNKVSIKGVSPVRDTGLTNQLRRRKAKVSYTDLRRLLLSFQQSLCSQCRFVHIDHRGARGFILQVALNIM
jgi:hypothetical protein